MKVHNLIAHDMILLDLKAQSGDALIREMVEHLKNKNLISKDKELCERLVQRENLGSTAIGDGVAIPHCKMKSVKKPIVMLGLSRKGVNFHSLDGNPSHLFFLVVSSPENPSLNLQILAAIAHLVRKADSLLNQIMASAHRGEILGIIKKKKNKFMTSRSDISLRVKDFFEEQKKRLKLEAPLGTIGFSRAIAPSPSQEGFSPILVWGEAESENYMRLPKRERAQALRTLWKGVACVLLVEGVSPDPEILKYAEVKKLSLFRSSSSKEVCLREVNAYVSLLSSEKIIVPGGLISLFDLGVLIMGDSGIGKSESALELISRGCEFISDDVTLVAKNIEGQLIGWSPDLSRNFMEVRGLGIINIKKIFGSQSVRDNSPIDLAIQLNRWEEGKDYDRLGLESPEGYSLLGVKIPQISLPVALGRNISTLIEVACKVHLCRSDGYSAPLDLMKRLDRVFSVTSEQG